MVSVLSGHPGNRHKMCQGRHEMCRITDLRSITGSRARAGIIAELFKEDAGGRSVSALAEAAGVRRTAAVREARRLVAAHVLRPMPLVSRVQGPLYEPDPSFAGHLELRRLVFVTVGLAGAIRRRLLPLDPHQLSWIHGPYAEGRLFRRQIRLAVITQRRREMSEVLTGLGRQIGYELVIDVATLAEWVTRLQKREMRARAIRRAARMWLVGDEELLRQSERAEMSSRATWKAALANWREELSDDWDDDRFDPFAGAASAL